jgi:transcriptional regulator with XRE-family HTH domain
MKSLKDRAVDLRRRGWSYNVISARLGVGKSTLSQWLRGIPYEPNKTIIERIRLGPARAAASKERRRSEQILLLKRRGRQELGRLSSRDLLLFGLGLYLGEGSKVYESVRIVNADPLVVKIAMRWLRRSCGVPERNFVITVHTYPDLSAGASIRYWSRVTGVPQRQFEPVQVDRRLNKSARKRRRLPYGTAHIKVYSRGDSRFGVALHRRIMGWLDAVQGQFAGVV